LFLQVEEETARGEFIAADGAKGVELQLEMRKAENKKMVKKHRQELRRRDWRECVIVCLFSVCLVLVAMISVR
jgi:hypothetical protein